MLTGTHSCRAHQNLCFPWNSGSTQTSKSDPSPAEEQQCDVSWRSNSNSHICLFRIQVPCLLQVCGVQWDGGSLHHVFKQAPPLLQWWEIRSLFSILHFLPRVAVLLWFLMRGISGNICVQSWYHDTENTSKQPNKVPHPFITTQPLTQVAAPTCGRRPFTLSMSANVSAV